MDRNTQHEVLIVFFVKSRENLAKVEEIYHEHVYRNLVIGIGHYLNQDVIG